MNCEPLVDIIRLEEDEHYGTFGVLLIQGEVFCVTLEPPDHLNEPMMSCIPAQQYLCSLHNSPKFGLTYQVRHVPGRSEILFHRGNQVKDTAGCILLAQHYGKLRGNRAILNSGNTFDDFMERMAGENEFKLTIKEVY